MSNKKINAIDIADSWGYAADADMFNCILSLMEYFDTRSFVSSERVDLLLRRCEMHASRVLNRRSDIDNLSLILKSNSPVITRVTGKLVNLDWFGSTPSLKEVSILDVCKSYGLDYSDAELLSCFYFRSVDLRKACGMIDDLISNIHFSDDEL